MPTDMRKTSILPAAASLVLGLCAGVTAQTPDSDQVFRVSITLDHGQAAVALTAGQLAALTTTNDGSLRRTDGASWTAGNDNIVVEYEYGADSPPAELVTAALIRFRARLNLFRSGVPDRATSWSSAEGGTYRIELPSEWRTGIPEVDAVYSRYSRRARSTTAGADGGSFPASRTLDYDPQYRSLFHGGRR